MIRGDRTAAGGGRGEGKRAERVAGASVEEREDVGSAQQRENSRGLNSITGPSLMKTELRGQSRSVNGGGDERQRRHE